MLDAQRRIVGEDHREMFVSMIAVARIAGSTDAVVKKVSTRAKGGELGLP